MKSFTKRSLWLVAILATYLASVSNAAQATSAQREKDIATTNEINIRQKAEQIGQANRIKDRYEIKIDETMRLLNVISTNYEVFSKHKEQLLNSDQGKQVANVSKSLVAFIHLYDNPSVTADIIKIKLSACQSISSIIKEERKRVDVGYMPSPKLLEELDMLYVWSKDNLSLIESQISTLKTILSETPITKDVQSLVTLSKAMDEYRARMPKMLADATIVGEQLAEEESQQVLIDAARLAKMERAMAERDLMLEKMKMEIEQLKLQQELELVKLKAQAEKDKYAAEMKYQDTLAELANLRKDASATRDITDLRANRARQQKLDVANREELVAKLKTSKIQGLLSYFTTKGYYQPGRRGSSYAEGPVSYSQLQSYGALSPSSAGLNKLLLTMNSFHNDRPKFCRRGRKLKGLSNDEHKKLVLIQSLLIELGPLMVEEGMLAP